MSSLYDTITQIVRQELQQQRQAEIAVVQEIHPHQDDGDKDNYACTVVLRDSDIVLKQVPLCSGRLGMVAIPDVGDVVLVQFINGDINAPVIVGSLYNDASRPPMSGEGAAVIHLPQGAGDGDAAHVELQTAQTLSLTVKLGGAMELKLQDDDPVVHLDVGGNATLKIDRDGTIMLEGQNNIVMKGSGNVDIEAGGQLNLKGSVINLN